MEDDDEHTEEPHPRSRRRRPGGGSEADEIETAPSEKASSSKGDVTAWLSLGKQAAESKCRELEGELAQARQELIRQDASMRVAREKIRHLEAENKGLLAAAEFREKEASSVQEGASLAEERSHANEKALANALEQLSDSGVSQSKKLVELAEVTERLKRTREALERAERLVFEQRQEADERLSEEERRRSETDALREKLTRVERKNTELMAKQAAGRLAKKMRGNFGRSSTFCASFCSCFRGRPVYRRVASPAPVAALPPATLDSSPWLA